ncbi:MAG: tetratricopeptide repeat protein [Bryobacteraceae bacterium]
MKFWLLLLPLSFLLAATPEEARKARDAQDRAGLESAVESLRATAAKQPDDAEAQYRLALANSYLAQIAIETGDRRLARSAAEAGIEAAERAVALKPSNGEYHRMLGTLCGQVIPANALLGLKYGRCALDSINKAIEIDPKSSAAFLSRGVGNFYLPPSFGGGVELAIQDFERAIALNAKSDEAYLWLGIALRKANRNGEARKAIVKSLELNPGRVWAKQQLEKTPAE